jgi:hypothetical protein
MRPAQRDAIMSKVRSPPLRATAEDCSISATCAVMLAAQRADGPEPADEPAR